MSTVVDMRALTLKPNSGLLCDGGKFSNVNIPRIDKDNIVFSSYDAILRQYLQKYQFYADQHSRAQKGLQYQPPSWFGLAEDFCSKFSHQMVLSTHPLYKDEMSSSYLYKGMHIAPSSEKSCNKNLLPNQTELEVGTRAPSGLQNAGRVQTMYSFIIIEFHFTNSYC